jgi:hypothetical protein
MKMRALAAGKLFLAGTLLAVCNASAEYASASLIEFLDQLD